MASIAETASLVDTHHHFLPQAFVKAIGEERLGASTPYGRMPDWSVERALAMCNRYGIERAILSISPGYAPVDEAIEFRAMHESNEEAAHIRATHPTRFGHFASIPMGNPSIALREIDHVLGTLRANGIVIASNYDGRYPGDPCFEEIWQELDRRQAIVFIHPTHPPYELISLPPESVLEYPFDSTRAAVSLVFAGVTGRYPDIRFILSHGGGTLPYVVSRATTAAGLTPGLLDRIGDPMKEFRKFNFETALSGSPFHLSAMLRFADPSRILFGTDFPYAPDIAIENNLAGQRQFPMEHAQRAAILHANATALLGEAH